jgi:hypothetical protein
VTNTVAAGKNNGVNFQIAEHLTSERFRITRLILPNEAASEAAMNSALPSPRGSYTGNALCAPRNGRRFFQCPVCGGWVDSTDPQQVAEHEGEPLPVQSVEIAAAS